MPLKAAQIARAQPTSPAEQLGGYSCRLGTLLQSQLSPEVCRAPLHPGLSGRPKGQGKPWETWWGFTLSPPNRNLALLVISQLASSAKGWLLLSPAASRTHGLLPSGGKGLPACTAAH